MSTSTKSQLLLTTAAAAFSIVATVSMPSRAEPLRSAVQLKFSLDDNSPCGFTDQEIKNFARDVVEKNGWKIVDDPRAETFMVQASFIALDRPRGSCVVAVTAAVWRDVYLNRQEDKTIRAATVTAAQFGAFNVGEKAIFARGLRAAIEAATKDAKEGRL